MEIGRAINLILEVGKQQRSIWGKQNFWYGFGFDSMQNDCFLQPSAMKRKIVLDASASRIGGRERRSMAAFYNFRTVFVGNAAEILSTDGGQIQH